MNPAASGSPVPAGHFQSSSGRTMLEYFRHAFPAGTPSSFRGALQVPAGFDQVEVLLCGFTLSTEVHEAPVRRAAVNVQKFDYDAATGILDVGVTTQFETDGQGSMSEVTFVVVLTDSAAARFSEIATSCGGTGECDIVRLVNSAVPAGMQYIGVATQIWDVGVPSGSPIPVNGIGGDIAGLAVGLPSVWLQYLAALRNGAWTNNMFCEWRGVVIAFDPAEISRFPTINLPYQYTILGQHQSARQVIAGSVSVPPGVPPFLGSLDVFQGFSLLFSQAINGPESPIWMIECSAWVPIIGPNGVFTQYGVFFGSQFGNTTNTVPDYGFQISRTVGLLH